MKKQNKSMISMMHRLVGSCGKYKASIRAAYIPGFFKGMFMKAPLMVCFLIVSGFMAGTVTKRACLVSGLVLLGCLVAQAVLQNISDRLQSAAGFKVFADKRMQLGDHFRKLSMGYFSEGNIGKVSSVLATDMNFIEENCMMVLEDLVGFMISQAMMIAFMFYLDWRLGLVALAGLAIIMLAGNLMTRISISHSMAKQVASQTLTSAVLEFAEGIGIIKTFNMLGEKSKEMNKAFEDSCDKAIGFEVAYAPWWTAYMIAYGIGTALVLLVAYLLGARGLITINFMMGMILFLFDTFAGMKAYYGNVARLTVTDACLDRIESVFDEAEISNDGRETLMTTEDATREEVIEVAKKSRCYDFIMKLPNGFDTVIGEGGADLSGGEQQRISIARCMLKDAPIVILDEATASVDADNEHFIQEAISELCRGKTLIVIAHRLNTIRNADKILVIKNGQIVEGGTHDELMAKKGQYASMVARQSC